MNDSNHIKGRWEELEIFCYKVLALPLQYYFTVDLYSVQMYIASSSIATKNVFKNGSIYDRLKERKWH